MNRKGLMICSVVLASAFVQAAENSVAEGNKAVSKQPPQLAPKEARNEQVKIKRGATFFMNYCSGCHSLRYMRYSRMVKNLGLTPFDGKLDSFLINNLIETQAKIEEPIVVSMLAGDARQWFGAVPPDLSLTARERGANWVYTYLKSFYADSSRPFGTDNFLVPKVAMPNVLEPLAKVMSPTQLDGALDDLMAFLGYVAEPVKLIRYRLGLIVLGFLGIFFLVIYQLKKIYWRHLS